MALIKRSLMPQRVQELGKIKLGGLGDERQKRGGSGTYRLPVKYRHFVVTGRERGPDGNFVRDEHIHAIVGDEPTELEAVLMFERPEDNFHSEFVVYRGRKKVWSCDGEVAQNLDAGKEGACPKASGGDCKCKPFARLHLQLMASPNLEGYHVYRTTSWESTNNIQSALERLYDHFGTLLGLPVKLVCYPADVTYEEGGQTKTSKATMAGLVLGMDFQEAATRIVARRAAVQIARTEVKQLAAGVAADLERADEEEADHLVQEFGLDPEASPDATEQAPGPEPEGKAGARRPSLLVSDDAAEAARLGARFGAEAQEPEDEGPDFEVVIEDEGPGDAGESNDEPWNPTVARRRLFATLKDVGIHEGVRKEWAGNHGLPRSTQQWTRTEFERAFEILEETRAELIAEIEPKVREGLEILGEDLRDVSRRVLGKEAPQHLADWQELHDDLHARADL